MIETAAEIPALVADRYRLLEQVGRGGMSWVYRAVDLQDDSIVAMKVLRPELADSPSIVRRMTSEATTMSTLDHPNICRVRGMESDAATGLRFVLLDWVPGGSASQHVQEFGPFRPRLACAILIQILCALSVVHRRGIIHRDVKPGNILLGGDGRALLTDFGVARVPDAEVETGHGAIIGSFAYMAPEQRLGPSAVGPRADIYGAGATLFNLVTGQSPIDLFLTDPGSARWDWVPSALHEPAQRATAQDPRERYPSVLHMARALVAHAEPRVFDRQAHLREWVR